MSTVPERPDVPPRLGRSADFTGELLRLAQVAPSPYHLDFYRLAQGVSPPAVPMPVATGWAA